MSLAASSLASEERDEVLQRGVLISAEQGRARATTTSPPGLSPQNESELITRILLEQGNKVNSSHLDMDEEDPAAE